MAKKKKSIEPPCLHCSVIFPVAVRWCSKCESHMGADSWGTGHDICDRCASGANDDYLKRKEGQAERIADALERQKDPANWLKNGVVEAYEAWINSPEYARRFDRDDH